MLCQFRRCKPRNLPQQRTKYTCATDYVGVALCFETHIFICWEVYLRHDTCTQDSLCSGRAPSSPDKLPAPALIAVVACVAAVGAELATGKTIVEQFQQAPGLIIGVSALFAVATLIVSVSCSHS